MHAHRCLLAPEDLRELLCDFDWTGDPDRERECVRARVLGGGGVTDPNDLEPDLDRWRGLRVERCDL